MVRRLHFTLILLASSQLLFTPQPVAAASPRANIIDRNGVVLATTTTAQSIYADPAKISDPANTAKALAKLLPGIDPEALLTKLTAQKRFVWVARHVDEATAQSMATLKLSGIGLRREDLRIYPRGSLTSHVVGITDYDVQNGMSGAESLFNARLTGGVKPVALSIDVRAQTVVREALVSAVASYDAKGAAGLLLDAQTGEIIAFVSLPDFAPGDRGSIAPDGYRNKLSDEVHELGGMFEVFTAAIALDDGRVTPATLLDVTHPMRLQSTLLRDDEPSTRPLSLADAFAHSSVIGAALISDRYSAQDQFASLRRLGLLDTMVVNGQPIVAQPLYHPNFIRAVDRTAIGYGCGIALAPLQAAAVATGIVNHGILAPPTLLRRDVAEVIPATHIVSEKTSTQMRALLRQAVSAGTGMPADVAGYEVGGKTGTSFKVTAGKYDKQRRTTWFFAGFPMNDTPRYTLLIMLDEPHSSVTTSRTPPTAQWNAVPTAGRVIAALAPILGMTPTERPSQPL
jgi:cell division protein FtsI (penicillin-binding protein 3)